MADFEAAFHSAPAESAEAPGRVNLLGEHTDYSCGFVLPAAIAQTTRVSLALSPDNDFHIHSAELGMAQSIVAGAADAAPGFSRYVYGCVQVLRARGHVVPPVLMDIESTVPIGIGLSSSAALEVAVLRAFRKLLALNLDDVELALLAQKAEVEYVGVRCGIMDQMASSLCTPDRMLFLDTRSLDFRLLPLPAGASVAVFDSGTSRSLTQSAYNERRAEVERAAQLLGVQSLRDVDDLDTVDALPPPLNRRARHVITENRRVIEGVGASASRFGELMTGSHLSLKNDYEVSTPALDSLVASLELQPGVYGARLTGAGFGGACVALVERGSAEDVKAGALAAYAKAGFTGRALV